MVIPFWELLSDFGYSSLIYSGNLYLRSIANILFSNGKLLRNVNKPFNAGSPYSPPRGGGGG